jgi:hypothetical protein
MPLAISRSCNWQTRLQKKIGILTFKGLGSNSLAQGGLDLKTQEDS